MHNLSTYEWFVHMAEVGEWRHGANILVRFRLKITHFLEDSIRKRTSFERKLVCGILWSRNLCRKRSIQSVVSLLRKVQFLWTLWEPLSYFEKIASLSEKTPLNKNTARENLLMKEHLEKDLHLEKFLSNFRKKNSCHARTLGDSVGDEPFSKYSILSLKRNLF